MTVLEAENHTLRQRLRALELELRQCRETQARLLAANEQLQNRVKVLERQLKPGADGRIHERVDVTFRVDGMNSRGDAAMGLARNVSLGGAFIEMALSLVPGERMTITFALQGRPFKFQAEVIRVMQTGFGVRFSIDPQQQTTLRQAISLLAA